MNIKNTATAGLLVVALLMVATQFCRADEDSTSSGPSWGIKGMIGAGYPNYANLPSGVTTNPAVSWAVGGLVIWSGEGVVSFAFQPELQFVQENGVSTGFTHRVDGQEVTYEITTTVNSLRLPVLGKVQFLDPRIVQPSLYAGPSFSYVLTATNEAQGVHYDVEDNTFQVGLTAGVDVTILSFLVVDVRFNTNFTNLSYDIGEIASGIDLTTSSFLVGLAFRF